MSRFQKQDFQTNEWCAKHAKSLLIFRTPNGKAVLQGPFVKQDIWFLRHGTIRTKTSLGIKELTVAHFYLPDVDTALWCIKPFVNQQLVISTGAWSRNGRSAPVFHDDEHWLVKKDSFFHLGRHGNFLGGFNTYHNGMLCTGIYEDANVKFQFSTASMFVEYDANNDLARQGPAPTFIDKHTQHIDKWPEMQLTRQQEFVHAIERCRNLLVNSGLLRI